MSCTSATVASRWRVHYTPRLDYLQVFYYPQDTPREMGPTEGIPASHFMRTKANYMGHIRNVKSTESTRAPAGSIFITVYSICHRKGKTPHPDPATCLNTTIGALPNPAVIGLPIRISTFPGPILARTLISSSSSLVSKRLKCSVGCAAKRTNILMVSVGHVKHRSNCRVTRRIYHTRCAVIRRCRCKT